MKGITPVPALSDSNTSV